MHRELSRRFGSKWFENEETGLDKWAQGRINAAKSDLDQKGNKCEASDVVAALSFGFWVSLLGLGKRLVTGGKANYQMTLWLPALRMAFPLRDRLTRKQAYIPLYHLRAFRNRIAHHEPIFQRDLASDYKSILEVTGWISPATAAWIEHHSRVPELLALRDDAREFKF